MDLKSGYPFWAVKNGLMHAFPPLAGALRCDVAVLGGGITGALVADELASHGHGVVVLDGRDIGWGSTAASTALLQYELDTHLVDLAARYGIGPAVDVYRACLQAVEDVAEIARTLRDVDLLSLSSLYFASRRRHAHRLREEFDLRQQHGLPVQWLDAAAVQERFEIDAPAAILSSRAAAVDPYRMTHRLLLRLQNQGVPVHDRSHVTDLEIGAKGVRLRTATGASVSARHVVIAAGYAAQQFLRRSVARNRSSYAFITDPLDAGQLRALGTTMAWETARPYLYFRPTGDGRLLVGGADDAIDIPARRDARVAAKADKLCKQMQALLPWLELQPVFSWAGTFAETEDGLPWIGPSRELGPRVLFAMAYGGNGISYSMLAAQILRARIERRKHPLAPLLGFSRRAGQGA